MQDYLDAGWAPVLAANKLGDFAALWALDAPWFETPNRRRNGWSGVSQLELAAPDGTSRTVFLKRQEDHNTFSWRHPLRGEPTFARELRHIRHYRRCGIPTLTPIYFAARQIEGHARAILATEALTGFAALDAWLAATPRSRPARLACIDPIARLLHTMHRHGIQHNCFLPKHVFVRVDDQGSVEARVIDLEKSRWRPLALFCALRDLDTFNRYCHGWRRTERLRFLLAYLGAAQLTPYAKWLWRRLAARSAKKFRA